MRSQEAGAWGRVQRMKCSYAMFSKFVRRDWCFDSGLHLRPGGTGLNAHFFEKRCPSGLYTITAAEKNGPGTILGERALRGGE